MENIKQNNDMADFKSFGGAEDISAKFLDDVYGRNGAATDKQAKEQMKPQERSIKHNDLENHKILAGNESSADALDRMYGRKTAVLPGVELFDGGKKSGSRK